MLSIPRARRSLSGWRLLPLLHDLLRHRCRAWPVMVLALALLVVQGGAQLHFVGHLAEIPTAASQPSAADEGDGDSLLTFCADCLALAGLDLPLGAHAPTPRATTPTSLAAGIDTPCVRNRAGLPPRCRAPPCLPVHLVTV